MRWDIKGFDQYEVDEAGQVWAKPQKRRFGHGGSGEVTRMTAR